MLIVSLAAMPWCRGSCLAEETLQPPLISEAPPNEILILQDGGVLVGEISRVGDRYQVRRAGGEIQVPAGSVLVVCHTLEEAYEHRRRQVGRPSIEAHLALSEWCLRHNLVPQAAREMLDARGLDPLHPRLKLLERRLAAAGKPRPRDLRRVVPAAHVERPEADANAPGPDNMVLDELPSGAIERFTRRVQPILVNNCTTSGCHHAGGRQTFQLDRALLHGLANRRTTMKNLAATLALVDRAQPQLSPLLTVPRRAHGGMPAAIFGPRQQAAFTHLVDWVALLTASTSPEQEAAAPGAQDVAAVGDGDPMRVLQSQDDAAADAAQALYADAGTDSEPATRRLRYGAQLRAWQPKDAFDPEIFNRQHQSRGQAEDEAEASAAPEHD